MNFRASIREEPPRNNLQPENQLRAYLPIADWLFKYDKAWLRPDVIAGLTTAAVVIPKAMAYATIAGLPVQVGLYTALIPMVIYAVTGSSRPLSVSTTTTIAVLAGAELSQVGTNGDSAALLKACATLAPFCWQLRSCG
jgi:MFS superfamily sulfate permease-like transporter